MTGRSTAIALALGVAVLGMVVRFPGALPGPRVVSAHDHLSVHPLFQAADAADRGRARHPHLSDPALQLAALDRRTVADLRAGRAPLWNPDLYGGAPLLGDAQSRPASPVTLLRAALPGAPGVAQDLGVAWLLTWCALGWTLLTRRLGITAPPALAVAAGAALTTPFLSVWLLHPHASTFVWLPWCLLAVESGTVVWTAAAVVGLWTGGHPGTWLHVSMLTALWWLVRSRRVGPVWGALAGTALAAPLWAPVLEQVARSTTAHARVGGTLDPTLLWDLAWPGWWGHPATETWTGTGSWADGQLHPGLAALAMGAWGLRTAVARDRGWLLVGAVWMACGIGAVAGLPGPVAHGRLASVAAVAWILLSALGTAHLASRAPHAAWLAPVLVLATGTWARWHDQHTLPPEAHAPEPAAWVAPLRAAVGDGRVLGVGWAAQPNTAALADLRDLRGYDLPISADTHALMGALSDRPRGPWYPVDTLPSPALLRWWAVRAVVAFPHDAAATQAWATEAGWTPLPLSPGSPLQAWVDPQPAPLARVVHRTEPMATPAAALSRVSQLVDGSVAPTGPTVPRLSEDAPATPVELEWTGGARMELRWPERSHAGFLVVSEAWAPGWRARLADGTPTPVWRAGGLSLGVEVPAGSTGAVLYYRPDGWIQGQRGLWVGLLLLGAAAGHRRWRQGRSRPRAPVPETMPDGGATTPHRASTAKSTAATPGGTGDGTRSGETSTPDPTARFRT